MNWWDRYVGIPFVDGGRDAKGLDCWGLVRLVYLDRLGAVLDNYAEIPARNLIEASRAFEAGAAHAETWWPVEKPITYDVVVMRVPRLRRIGHVGIMIDHTRLLHVEQHSHTVVVPIDHYSVAGRIAGFRRYLG